MKISKSILSVAMLSCIFASQAASAAEAATTTGNPFIDNMKAGYMMKASYFDRQSDGYEDKAGGAFENEALGLGGWLYLTTGEIGDALSFGGTYNFVIPVSSPDDSGYNYILNDPDQGAVSVVGELYAKLRYMETNNLVVGRQSVNQAWYLPDIVRFYNKLDQSMIGRRDVRAMQPIHYEGVTAQGRLNNDTVRYYAGYIWNARQINDNEFRNLFQAAYQTTKWPEENKEGDSDGVAYTGVQYKPSNDLMMEGSYYHFDNMMNNVYLDLDYVYRMKDKNYLRFGAQYMYQEGSGDNLVVNGDGSKGDDFSTDYLGFYTEMRLNPYVVPYAMIGWTDDGQEIRSPYSIGPSYMVQRIGENSKAGEHTWIVGSIFDLRSLFVPGLSFEINYGERTNRLDNDGNALADWNELSTDLVYLNTKEGIWKNLRTRLRYASVKEDGNGEVIGSREQNDLRVDFTLPIEFK